MWTVGFLQHLAVQPWYLHQTTAASLCSGNKERGEEEEVDEG